MRAARMIRVNRPTPNQRQNPDMTVPGVMSVLMLRSSRPGLAPKWRPPGLIAAGQVARRGRRRRRRGPHRGCGRSLGGLHDHAADVLGDLRDDGVSSGRNQFGGKPISVSIIKTGGLHRPVNAITPCTRLSTAALALAWPPQEPGDAES